nr:uncharacterized protein LOC109411644 [Aedes albopictus]
MGIDSCVPTPGIADDNNRALVYVTNDSLKKLSEAKYWEAKGSGRWRQLHCGPFPNNSQRLHPSKDASKKLRWERTVICKRLPDCKIKREAFKSEALFRNEVEFYNCIMPEFIAFQKRKTKDVSHIFMAVPRCYLAQNDLVMLEDLRVRRFTMPDRQAGLGMEQMKAILVELSKFHAVSLAYKMQHPNEFKRLTSKISEGIFTKENTEWYRNYYEILTKNALQMVTQTIPDQKEYLAKMKGFLDNCFGNLVELVSRKSKLSVICHGDCWTNNILFKHDEKGSITEICFLDFQLIRHGSLALDLAYLIYCFTESALRKANLQTWLFHLPPAVGEVPQSAGISAGLLHR